MRKYLSVHNKWLLTKNSKVLAVSQCPVRDWADTVWLQTHHDFNDDDDDDDDDDDEEEEEEEEDDNNNNNNNVL